MVGVVQHSPYGLQLVLRVLHLYLDLYLYLDCGWTQRRIAEQFGHRPCQKTISRMLRRYQTGEPLALVGRSGVKCSTRKLSQAAQDELVDLVGMDELLRLTDIASHLSRRMGRRYMAWDISRALTDVGFTRVRVTQRAREADPLSQAAYVAMVAAKYTRRQYIFVDEVAADSRCVNKPYAWVLEGQRSTSSHIFIRGKRCTTIAAMSCDGLLMTMTMEGAADKDAFTTFMQQLIARGYIQAFQVNGVPTNNPGSVVIMDNASIHSKSDLSILVEWGARAKLQYLPPYSPHLNPIEKLCGKLKKWLQENRAFVSQVDPYLAIQTAFNQITQQDCMEWICFNECYNV